MFYRVHERCLVIYLHKNLFRVYESYSLSTFQVMTSDHMYIILHQAVAHMIDVTMNAHAICPEVEP